ncbi:hypothetical protein ACFFP0_11580 [Rhizobium puerariae]|uniref:Dynamin n=1 Tax=Rhizobium puerariae TaxID=1585791 RepID=A0ABV6AHB2_9HYPH
MMTRTTGANAILGAIVVVLLLLAVGYYIRGNSNETAQGPGAPAATDTVQTPSAPPHETDPASTGSTNR